MFGDVSVGKRSHISAQTNDLDVELDEDVSELVSRALSSSSRPRAAKNSKATAAGIVRQFNERIRQMRSKDGWTWSEIGDLLSAETGQKITSGALSRAASRHRSAAQSSTVNKKNKTALKKLIDPAISSRPPEAAPSSQPSTQSQGDARDSWLCFDN